MKYAIKRELQYWNQPGERKYRILEDSTGMYFAVRNVHNLILPSSVLEYSQQQNEIVAILEQGEWIVTEYLHDYQPVIIRGSCDYYDDLRVDEYNDYFSQSLNCIDYYTRMVLAHCDFIEHTGWMFADRTGTNVMVDKTYTDFKIIDVMSLTPAADTQMFPVSEFFYPRVWEKALAHKHGLKRPSIANIKELAYAAS